MRRQVLRLQKGSQNKSPIGRTTILIGTDIPTLSKRDLMEALKALKTNEIVIGPANDGGYWLLGLSGRLVKPVATWPFCGIPWGTENVLSKTLKEANLAGASYCLLRKQRDIDYLEDLLPWQA